MEPKIIQIAVSGDEEADSVYALREDGTVWRCFCRYNSQTAWERLRSPAETDALMAEPE